MLRDDMFSNFIAHSLAEGDVNLDFLSRTNKAKTGLAFMSLDVQPERIFEFYQHPLVSASTALSALSALSAVRK